MNRACRIFLALTFVSLLSPSEFSHAVDPSSRPAQRDAYKRLTEKEVEKTQNAANLRGEAIRLARAGDMPKAIAALRGCLGLLIDVLGDKSDAVFQCYVELASFYSAADEPRAAIGSLQTALSIVSPVDPDAHLRKADLYLELGRLYRRVPDYEKVLDYYQRSYAECKAGGSVNAAVLLNNIGFLHLQMGRLDKSITALLQALAEAEADPRLGRNHPETGTCLNNLALAYEAVGNRKKGIPFAERAVAIRQKTLGMHNRTAQSLVNLGMLYVLDDDPTKGFPYVEAGLNMAMLVLPPDSLDLALWHANYALALGSLNPHDPRIAVEYESAIRIAMKNSRNPETPILLSNLSTKIKDPRLRAKVFETAMTDFRSTGRADNTWYSHALKLRADAEIESDKLTQASATYDQVRRIEFRQAGSTMSILSQQEQELLWRNTQERSLSSELALVLAAPKDGTLVNRTATWLVNFKGLGNRVRRQQEQIYKQARTSPKLRESIQSIERNRQAQARLALINPSSEGYAAATSRLATLENEASQLTREVATQAGVQSDATWVELDAVRDAMPPGSLIIDIAQVSKQIASTPKFQSQRRYVAWVIPPARKGNLQVVDLGDADDIDRQIESLRRVLVWSRAGRSSAVTKKQTELATRQPAVASGDRGFDLTGDDAMAEAERAASFERLAARIWKPLMPYVADATQLYLGPDGALWLLPWAAIPVDKDNFLVDKFALNYLISARDLLSSPRPTGFECADPVVFADPKFDLEDADVAAAGRAVLQANSQQDSDPQIRTDKSRLPQVGPLPGTAVEAESIKPSIEKLTGKHVSIYRAATALKSVAQALAHPKVVVFCTHGFFLPGQRLKSEEDNRNLLLGGVRSVQMAADGKALENPLLRCGLLLAGCNRRNAGQSRTSDDGVLTGIEILAIDLRGTELVVLSACETGLGVINNGQGVAGLRQAFQLAGAEAVVATLWKIPDAESALLMNDFFANLAAGQTKGQALRNAQRKWRDIWRKQYGAGHPFFWAAFTVTGR